jgi:hypothetical protein
MHVECVPSMCKALVSIQYKIGGKLERDIKTMNQQSYHFLSMSKTNLETKLTKAIYS